MLKNISDTKLAIQLNTIIEDLENCKSLIEIKNLKKLKGKGNYYRIRIGNYRLGLKLEEETITLLRFLNRKDIYTYFP
jgi:mRNA-degrading endonuclease RelE of RelBE toxin-antitoxin system